MISCVFMIHEEYIKSPTKHQTNTKKFVNKSRYNIFV